MYDVVGGEKINSLDVMIMQKAINQNNGRISGTFQINPYSSRRSIILRDYTGDIKTYIGLYAIYSNTLSAPHIRTDNSIIAEDDENKTTIVPSGITTPTITQTSLEESKKNFEKFQNALDIIKNIDIYKYNLKNEENKTKKHIGFVIGENYKYSQEVTSKENDGVDLYSFTSLCCKAIQELTQKVETLEKEIKTLKEEKKQ